MEAIRIEVAVRSKATMLSKLGAETFYTYFGPHNTPSDIEEYVGQAFSLDQVQKELDEPGSIFLIAYVDDQVAGYARLRLSTEKLKQLEGIKHIEMQRIYVRPDFLKKKVGAALMQHSIDLAREKGFNAIWLGVWEKNDRGIAFYQRWGFVKFGSHSFMLGKDLQTDFLMLKRI